jgi:DUF1680 family protein
MAAVNPAFNRNEYGRPLDVSGTPGSYLTIARTWHAGDRVEFTMPMRVTAESLRDDPTKMAFLYGPLVLAGQFPLGQIDFDLQHNQGPEIQEATAIKVPSLASHGAQLADWIKPVAGQPLEFRTTGQTQDVTLKPISQSWERFTVYFTVS